MAVVISRSLVLSAPAEVLAATLPIIGWDNRVSAAGVAADHEVAGYPATNLANVSTAAGWRSGSTADQFITFAIDGSEAIDYLALARHNLGSAGVNVSVEAIDEDDEWQEVVPPVVLAGDGPALLRFDAVFASQVRLRLQPAGVVPRIAVIYIGALLVLPMGVQPGLVPLPFGNSDEIVTGQAESGDFLGRIVTSQSLTSSYSIQYVADAWFRANMARFMRAARTRPFFFAWSPAAHPGDVGYAWLTSDLRPEVVMTGEGEKVSFSLQLQAVAL